MAQVITIAQQKGGAGKTTLAAHLGVMLSEFGLNVAMIDVDPQGSLSAWHKVRKQLGGDVAPLTFIQTNGEQLGSEIRRINDVHDFIIVDSPPHADTDARNAVAHSNLVIIPMQPSPLDLWATQATLKMARKAKIPVKMVLNRVNPQAKLSQKMREEMKDLSLSLFGNRVIYAGALLVGKGVSEMAPSSVATKEIEALASDLLDYFGYDLEEVGADEAAA